MKEILLVLEVVMVAGFCVMSGISIAVMLHDRRPKQALPKDLAESHHRRAA